MTRWAMVIDLGKCVGCQTCVHVCERANNIPHGAKWRQLIEKETPGHLKGERIFLTLSCMHCANPPCLSACPTGATYRRKDGIVDINLKLCMGCGSCIVACPYQARKISQEDKFVIDIQPGENKAVVKNLDRVGICTKCDFCSSIIEAGLENGLQPGSDPEATPLCVRSCISNALFFGDLDDSNSTVSTMIHEHKTMRLQDNLETDPSVFYIVDMINFQKDRTEEN